MKKKLIMLLLLFAFSFLTIGNQVSASGISGTIDTTYHYAWGENIGWVDFAQVGVTDTTLTGSAYGENIGWIDLSTVTNNKEGTLGGYAWGENIGWVDFSQVTIGTDGVFAGQAYGENIGWITFGTSNNKVVTDWRPASKRNFISSSGSFGGSGGTYHPVTITPPPATTPPPTTPPPATPTAPSTPPAPSTPNTCSITNTLGVGWQGPEVTCLQTKLHSHVDGIFGKKTKASVILFQKANKLKADGVVGPKTRVLLSNY